MDKEKIIEGRKEYIQELYDDDDDGRFQTNAHNQWEGPSILKAESEDAIQHMNGSKSLGPDKITVEEINACGELV